MINYHNRLSIRFITPFYHDHFPIVLIVFLFKLTLIAILFNQLLFVIKVNQEDKA